MATQTQVNNFIATISPIVQKKVKEHGWGVASAIIAQAAIESAWGTSGLAKNCNNFFGMKWSTGCGCDYKEYKTNEQKSDGSYYTVTAKFRKYASVEAGIEGYFKFIESYTRYKSVMKSTTYSDYAKNLKTAGWATSINYANTIINTVKARSLTKYDAVVVVVNNYYPIYTGTSTSIVSALGAVGEKNTSLANRKKIAAANGISNYAGTAAQNTKMLSLLKGGVLKKCS